MSMKICKECGKEVSRSAKICPNCGKKLKSSGLRIFLGILILLIGIASIASLGEDNTSPTSANSTELQQQKVTLEKFNKLETGMTYKQVVEIIGEDGTLSTESSYGNQSLKVYYWYSSNGISNATVSFSNGKLTAKSQIGLD